MKRLSLIICFALVSLFAKAQWTFQESTTSSDLSSVFFLDSNIGYAVGGEHSPYYPDEESNGIIIKTLNAGATWDIVWRGTYLTTLNSVCFIDANIGFVVGYSLESNKGLILKSIDGGATWTEFYDDSGLELESVYFTDANTGYIVGGTGVHYQKAGTSNGAGIAYILKTIDGGANWTPFLSETNGRLNSVFFSDANTGYAVGGCRHCFPTGPATGMCVYYQGIIKTVDAGTTWDTLSTGTTSILNSVYFTDNNTGYVAGEDSCCGIILKTFDGGSTWDTLVSGTTIPLNSIFFTNANTGYAVGGYYEYNGGVIVKAIGVILKTIDAGATWDTLSLGKRTTEALNSVFFTDANTGYAVGFLGTLLKTTNGGGFPTVVENKSPSQTFTIYPNPATNKISITTIHKSKGETQVSIFSINGQLIQRAKFQNQGRFEMDLSILQKGIYLLRIQSAEGVETQKLMLQ